MARSKKKSESKKVIVTDVQDNGISKITNKQVYTVTLIDADTGKTMITYPDCSMRNYAGNWRSICESDNPRGVYHAEVIMTDKQTRGGVDIMDADSSMELDFPIDEPDVWQVVDLIKQNPVIDQNTLFRY